MDAEAVPFALQAEFRDSEEMLPQCAIAGASRLQIRRRLACFFQPRRIGFAGRRRRRIDLFEIFHRHRRLLRVRTFEIRIEIDRRDAAMADLGDELAHLQAPVAQMHVAHDMPAIGAEQPLQRIADHRRAQMPDMHRLCDVRSAEIDDRGLALPRFGRTQPLILRHCAGTFRQRGIGHIEIDEARPRDLDFGKDRIGLQTQCNLFRNRPRIHLRGARSLHRAVALELRHVRTIGFLDLAEAFRKPFGRERGLRDRAQFGRKARHGAYL